MLISFAQYFTEKMRGKPISADFAFYVVENEGITTYIIAKLLLMSTSTVNRISERKI